MPRIAITLDLEMLDQIFTYERHDTRELLHFNASLLGRIQRQAPDLFTRITIDITDEIYQMVMQYRGIEEAKVAAVDPAQIDLPGLAVIFPPDSSVTIDGHHRLVRRYRAGLRTMDFWYTTPEVWKLCLMPTSAEEDADAKSFMPASPPDGTARIATTATFHRDRKR